MGDDVFDHPARSAGITHPRRKLGIKGGCCRTTVFDPFAIEPITSRVFHVGREILDRPVRGKTMYIACLRRVVAGQVAVPGPGAVKGARAQGLVFIPSGGGLGGKREGRLIIAAMHMCGLHPEPKATINTSIRGPALS